MTLLGALVAGAAVGARHAFEADHVAAVATLVDDGTDRRALVGVSWGVGHSLPVVALGLALVLAGVRLPETAVRLVEALVGLVLVGLGGRTLWRLRRSGHRHDDRPSDHGHIRLGTLSLGTTHSHRLNGDSLAVGALHGVAGSGALVVLLVSTAPTVDTALAFLAGFAALSVLAMGAVSVAWGTAVRSGVGQYLEAAAGLASVLVGLALLAEQVGVAVPF